MALCALVLVGCSGDPTPNLSSDPPVSGSVTVPGSSARTSSVAPSGSSTAASTGVGAPTGVPTTGPNVSPGEKPPTPAADPDTAAGAIDFATYWMQAIDWGYATESSALPRMLYAPACTTCATFMRNFDEAERAGVVFSGGRYSLSSAGPSTMSQRNGSEYAADITLSVSKFEARNNAGAVVDTEPAHSRIVSTVWVAHLQGRWKVVDWLLTVYGT